MRILIMGLPGSGKTTLAANIVNNLRDQDEDVAWLSADAVRAAYDDWDFSFQGRIRQCRRMSDLAFEYEAEDKIVICDFVCPLKELRELFAPNLMIWMDTIKQSRFSNTDKIFEPATEADYIITSNSKYPWDVIISEQILFMVRN